VGANLSQFGEESVRLGEGTATRLLVGHGSSGGDGTRPAGHRRDRGM